MHMPSLKQKKMYADWEKGIVLSNLRRQAQLCWNNICNAIEKQVS